MDFKEKLDYLLDAEYYALFEEEKGALCMQICEDGRPIYNYAKGQAQKDGELCPADINTVFNIGSVSKMFAAAAILILCGRGMVKLDGKVCDYIENFRVGGKKETRITPKMLINHTSGLRGTVFGCGVGYEYIDVKSDYLKKLNQSTLQYEPGADRIYCDDGFLIAQILTEKISGRPFEEFVRKEIFDAVGMDNTGKSIGERIGSDYGSAYCIKQKPPETISMYGVAGFSSSVRDLCLFGNNICGAVGGIIPEDMADELFEKNSAGVGWDCRLETENSELWIKKGRSTDYSSMLIVCPQRRITVSLLCSSAQRSQNTDEEIVRAVFGKIIPRTEEPGLSLEHIAQLGGIYVGNWDVYELTADVKNGELIMHSTSGITADVRFSYDNGRFYKNGTNTDIYYLKKMSAGGVGLFRKDRSLGGESLKYKRIDEPYVSRESAEWLERKLWLKINQTPAEVVFSPEAFHVTKPEFIFSGTAKYNDIIIFYGTQRMLNKARATPVLTSGYQLEAVFENCGEGIIAKLSGAKYLMAEQCLQALCVGQSCVEIGKNGFNVWYKSDSDGIIRLQCEGRGRAVLFDKRRRSCFDTLFDGEYAQVKSGMFVKIIGDIGDRVRITYDAHANVNNAQ